MLDTAPVSPSHGARITKDRPCVREVRTVKAATWSAPIRCRDEVHTWAVPFTACCSWSEQRVATGHVQAQLGRRMLPGARPVPRRRVGVVLRGRGQGGRGQGRQDRSDPPYPSYLCHVFSPKITAAPPRRRFGPTTAGMGERFAAIRVVTGMSSARRRRRAADYASGTLSRSASQAVAAASLGIRQSPRGLIVPPALTFGPFGRALRLNWLAKKRRQNTSSQCRIWPRSYAARRSCG